MVVYQNPSEINIQGNLESNLNNILGNNQDISKSLPNSN